MLANVCNMIDDVIYSWKISQRFTTVEFYALHWGYAAAYNLVTVLERYWKWREGLSNKDLHKLRMIKGGYKDGKN